MLKKLKRIEVEEKLKSLGLEVFTPLEFRRIFGVSQNTANGIYQPSCIFLERALSHYGKSGFRKE